MLHDPEASFRTDLAAKLSSAQTSLENKLAELRARITTGSDNLAVAQAASQLRGLSDLRQRIERADPSTLLTLQSEVAAAVAVTRSFAEQAAAPASQSQLAGQVALYQVSEAARRSTEGFENAYYKQHIFDQYLQFSSQRDEEEYRRREQERRQDIDKALAERTPEGNLRANQLSIEQLKDAGAHGADRSPEFKPMLQRLESDGAALHSAIDNAKPKDAPTPVQHSASAANDGDLSGAVTPDVLASIKAAKIAVADQTQDGHGLNTTATAKTVPSRA